MNKILAGAFFLATLVACGVEWFPSNEVSTSSVSISTKSLAAGTVGTPYSQSLVATGGTSPYTWTVSSGDIPAGLSLSTAGVISGTPTTAGTSTFTVQLSDSTTPPLTATQELTIVMALPGALAAGQTATLRSNDSIMVPPGTTITANGNSITVTGHNGRLITSPGAVLAVPSDATETADNVVIASL
ncbi:Ig domain-containing protein [Geomonas sp. RF6]|uniref:Ig domain-containing protein n=1 Tax=Geomonas sp. RF6 TaxID=2897342 RepID=UPI001E39B3F4|nr:Ig domain-containing protein [Geomonas sp. RF6]UFS69545.1 Ig domain-containing protein [Geomonas sp. RF6]